jgi:hypothetical protein
VDLSNGMTVIYSDISEDGETHGHSCLLKDSIPKTLPYDLALRINKDGNMPQLRFNEDGVWQDFVSGRRDWTEGRAVVCLPAAVPWCPPERPPCEPSQANKECWKDQQGPGCCF